MLRFLLLLSLAACGGEAGTDCEIFSDCPTGQGCRAGTCVPLEDGSTADASDGGGDAGFCGDGTVTLPETCDEGDANSDVLADACRSDCQPARCGDEVVDTGESCDDGNDTSFDGCTACRLDDACLLAHGGESTFVSVRIGPDGSLGAIFTVTAAESFAGRFDTSHGIAACGRRAFGVLAGAIQTIDVADDGTLRLGPQTVLAGVREVACLGDDLVATTNMGRTVGLAHFRVASDGSLELIGSASFDLEGTIMERSDVERAIVLPRSDTEVWVLAFPSGLLMSRSLATRFVVGDGDPTRVEGPIDIGATTDGRDAAFAGDAGLWAVGLTGDCIAHWSAADAFGGRAMTSCGENAAGATAVVGRRGSDEAWASTSAGLLHLGVADTISLLDARSSAGNQALAALFDDRLLAALERTEGTLSLFPLDEAGTIGERIEQRRLVGVSDAQGLASLPCRGDE